MRSRITWERIVVDSFKEFSTSLSYVLWLGQMVSVTLS